MKCSVCLHPLRKVAMRTTNGRRSPIYSKCPQIGDVAFHPARAHAKQPEAKPAPDVASASGSDEKE